MDDRLTERGEPAFTINGRPISSFADLTEDEKYLALWAYALGKRDAEGAAPVTLRRIYNRTVWAESELANQTEPDPDKPGKARPTAGNRVWHSVIDETRPWNR